MKIVIILMTWFASFTSFGSEFEFVLSPEVYQNSKQNFVSHKKSGRFGSYLTMNINYQPVKKLFKQLEVLDAKKLKSRGEAHITVITPVEYFDFLKEKISINEIEEIAKKHKIQKSKFKVICMGRGTARLSNKNAETYYVVVESRDLLKIRQEIGKKFVAKGGNASNFSAESYYPHITLGFTKRDLHEADGVIKNLNSCFGKLKISPVN